MILGGEKTDPPLCQPIGALQPVEGIVCKIQQMDNKKATLKKYFEPYKLTKTNGDHFLANFMQVKEHNFLLLCRPLPSSSPAEAKAK